MPTLFAALHLLLRQFSDVMCDRNQAELDLHLDIWLETEAHESVVLPCERNTKKEGDYQPFGFLSPSYSIKAYF